MFFHVRANGEVYTTDYSLQDDVAEAALVETSEQRTVILNCSSFEIAQECFGYFAQSNFG